MLFELYLGIFLVGIIFIILGTKIDVSLGYIGGAVIFLLGIAVLATSIGIHTHDDIMITYSYANDSSTRPSSINETHTPVIQNLETLIPGSGVTLSHLLGVFGSFAGVIAMIAIYAGRKKPHES